MVTIVAATGFAAWALLIGAAIAGIGFGIFINGSISKRRRK